MPIFILIVVAIIVLFILNKKRKQKKEAAAAAKREAAKAKKREEREARLVNGEPVERTNIPEVDSIDEEMIGPNGKVYHMPHYIGDYSKKVEGDWEPIYKLMITERYGEYLYSEMVKGFKMFASDQRNMINYLLFAAEAYAYGQPDSNDLYQSERYLIRRMQDRARALEDDGYYHLPYPPVDIDKAIHYYEILNDIMENHRDKLSQDLDDATLYRMMHAWAELGHLYSRTEDKRGSRGYDQGFRGVVKDEHARMDIIHAMMAGYPRNPESFDNITAAMIVDWVNSGSAMAKAIVLDYRSYDNLDKKRLAASPEEAAKVYAEGKAAGDAYCTYMLGRCAMYGYGMEMDKNYGWECLNEAAKGSCASAAHLMMLLADSEEDKESFKRILDMILSQLDNAKL